MAGRNHFVHLLEQIAELGTELMRAPRYDMKFAPIVYPQDWEYRCLADSIRVVIRRSDRPGLVNPMELSILVGNHEVTITNPLVVPRDALLRLGIRGGAVMADHMDAVTEHHESVAYLEWDEKLLRRECGRMLSSFKRFLKGYKRQWLSLCRQAALQEVEYLPELERFLACHHDLPNSIKRVAVMARLGGANSLAYVLSEKEETVREILNRRYARSLRGYYDAVRDMYRLCRYLMLLSATELMLEFGYNNDDDMLVDLYYDTFLTRVYTHRSSPPSCTVECTVLTRSGEPVHWEEYHRARYTGGTNWRGHLWSGLFDDVTATFGRSIRPGIGLMHRLLSEKPVVLEVHASMISAGYRS
jgi:hypothetical protein